MEHETKRGRILVVDDERLLRSALCRALEGEGYELDQAADAASALAAAGREAPDLVLLDQQLPDRTGTEALADLRRIAPGASVIMITAHASVPGAVAAMRGGADDYVEKPFELDEVTRRIDLALRARRLREQLERQSEVAQREWGVNELVAVSARMQQTLSMTRRVAASEAATILLLGESGVGKGLVARAIHYGSPLRAKPFMHITCTALAETLLDSELFGHEKGAFTDAKSQKKGLLELADEGTVFLDEIGDLSAGLQGKLLRFLEDRAFRRVGGTRDIRVSVRVIAATNKDLRGEVEAGRFREDLYFRLNVIPIEIPPLRLRVEDIEPLARRFVAHFDREFDKDARDFDPQVLPRMRAYSWPGNVRELRNAIERAVLLSEGPVLTLADFPLEMSDGRDGVEAGRAPWFSLPPSGIDLELLERDFVRQALERSHGNRTRAARLLSMNRDQIRYRIEKFHIDGQRVQAR